LSEALQVAFLGGGNMARALIQGMLRQGVSAAQMHVGEPSSEQRAALQRDFAVRTTESNALAISGARLVVLAVKPQQLRAVLEPLRGALQSGRALLLSIAAGVRLADLARVCPGVPLIRAMPNRAALVGAGVTGLYAPAHLDATLRGLAESAMAAAGRTVWVDRESDLDIVTALSGSGPAYFFLLAEHMARAARELGLAAPTAELLARETLRGAGALLVDPATLAAQRAAVTSKGGTTAAALAVLDTRDFGSLIGAALTAATRRSEQLAEQFSSQDNPASGANASAAP
jgi:pyrroline-5-carboxylate reductase